MSADDVKKGISKFIEWNKKVLSDPTPVISWERHWDGPEWDKDWKGKNSQVEYRNFFGCWTYKEQHAPQIEQPIKNNRRMVNVTPQKEETSYDKTRRIENAR